MPTNDALPNFLAPHPAVLCNEDRPRFDQLLRQLLAIYQPANHIAAGLVHDIAIAKWQISRYHTCLTVQWNLSLIESAKEPSNLAPEFAEIESMARATEMLLGRAALARKITREIGFLQKSVHALEKQIEYMHKSFPATAEPQKQTQPDVENEALSDPIYTTDHHPAVIDAYRRQYPRRRIVILPLDYVAKSTNFEDDDLPTAPRKAA